MLVSASSILSLTTFNLFFGFESVQTLHSRLECEADVELPAVDPTVINPIVRFGDQRVKKANKNSALDLLIKGDLLGRREFVYYVSDAA